MSPLLENVGTPVGASGTDTFNDQVWGPDEYNIDLATPAQLVATYDRMRKSDGRVRSCINRLFYALLAAEWRVDPVDEDDAEEVEIAEFVKSVLMPGETYGYAGYSTWYQTLRQALLFTVYGFSILEKVRGWRPADGKQVIASFEGRLAKSIRHFNLTSKGPTKLESVTQWTQRNGEKTLRAEDLVVMAFNREGDNWWGESIMRPAHNHWRLKRNILNFDAIHKERMGGIFWVQSKEGTSPDKDQIREAKKVLQEFRVHEKQGLYFPSVFEFHAMFPSGEGMKTLESVELHNKEIEASMICEYASAKDGLGSGHASDNQMDSMLMANQAIATQVSDEFGAQAVVEMVDVNYGPREKYPRVACENFLQMKPQRAAELLKPLIEVGLIRVDKPLRVHFRKKFSLPEEDEATLEEVPGQAAPAGGGGGTAEDGPSMDVGPVPRTPPSPQVEKVVRDRRGRFAKRSVAGQMALPYRRDPFPHEGKVNFDGIRSMLDEAPVRVWHRDVAPVRARQIAALSVAAAEATEAELAQGRLPKPELAELTEAILRGVRGSYSAGRKAVLEQAQAAKVRKQDDLEGDFPAEPTRAQSTWLRRLSQAAALGMTAWLVNEAVLSGMRAKDLELPREAAVAAIRAALDRLSVPRAQADLGGTLTQAFTTGMVEQGQSMKERISSVFYSARLDDGTCDPCWAMDGEELGDDWASAVPNPECEGGYRCRCVPVFVFREEAA